MFCQKYAALMMAGGRSERMRACGSDNHKALRTVLGVTLIERNIQTLLLFGFRRLFIAVNAAESEVIRWINQEGRALADASHADVCLLLETRPLGTIGAAALLPEGTENVLIVNVDNLTSLDLNALANFHLECGVAATIASHDEPFRIPFGRLETRGELVTEYREKPEILVPISSGTYVLHRRAIERISPAVRTDVPQLVNRLIQEGEHVACFRHRAHWIDVNDETSLLRAEALLKSGEKEWPQPSERIHASV
jgi:NDP-sugar pyrophosphorylase family protein